MPGEPIDAGTPKFWQGMLTQMFILAVYATVQRIHRRGLVFFALLAVLSLWLALGKFGGLFWIAFYLVPGLYRTEVPAQEISDGVYRAALNFPKAGAYYVYVASPENKRVIKSFVCSTCSQG